MLNRIKALALPPDVPETNFGKMREALQLAKDALSLALSDVNWRKDSLTQPVIHKAYNCAHEALALPTADHLPDAGEMVVDHFPDATKMIETAVPVGDRERFEAYFAWSRQSKGANRRPNFERFEEDGTYKDDHTQLHWWTWQQALSAGDAVDAQRYRWLMNNCTLGIKQNGVGWSLNTSACVAPDCIKDVGAAIDAAMRKDKP